MNPAVSSELVGRLMGALEQNIKEPLDHEESTKVYAAFHRALDRSPVEQVCEAIDQLKQRGLGVSIVKCGGLELQIHQLHPPGKPVGDEAPTDDDPIFDAVR